jgi:hypothetical protein
MVRLVEAVADNLQIIRFNEETYDHRKQRKCQDDQDAARF